MNETTIRLIAALNERLARMPPVTMAAVMAGTTPLEFRLLVTLTMEQIGREEPTVRELTPEMIAAREVAR